MFSSHTGFSLFPLLIFSIRSSVIESVGIEPNHAKVYGCLPSSIHCPQLFPHNLALSSFIGHDGQVDIMASLSFWAVTTVCWSVYFNLVPHHIRPYSF